MGEEYTVDRIVNIIKYYNDNLKYTQAILEDALKSVGIAQYGIESVMPKGTGTSNPVESQVFRSIKATQNVADKLTDMKYLQDRLYRIDDETDAIILYSFMTGKTQREISNILGVTDMAIHKRVWNIAKKIKGELSTREVEKV